MMLIVHSKLRVLVLLVYKIERFRIIQTNTGGISIEMNAYMLREKLILFYHS